MLKGRFYFTQTLHRNLIGEFSNRDMDRNATEGANFLDSTSDDAFIGRYRSVWLSNENPEVTDLTIAYKNNDKLLYTLEWRQDGNFIFRGEGFIVNNMLIGDYSH